MRAAAVTASACTGGSVGFAFAAQTSQRDQLGSQLLKQTRSGALAASRAGLGQHQGLQERSGRDGTEQVAEENRV